MEKSPEFEPVPIELHRPELELAWRGLCISVKAGQLDRDMAVKMLQEWNDTPSTVENSETTG